MLRARGRIRGRRADGSDPGAAPRARSRSRRRGLGDGLPRVLRAGRVVAAPRQATGTEMLVATDQRGRGHARRERRRGLTEAPGAHGRRGAARRPAARASGCATQHARLRPGTDDRGAVALRGRARCGGGGGGCGCVRRRSRCGVRSRTRLGAAPGCAARQQLSTRGPRRQRRADAKARKARGSRTLQIRRRAGYGPSLAASSAAPGPRGSACGGETRASCCAGDCWVGTCASRMASSGPG